MIFGGVARGNYYNSKELPARNPKNGQGPGFWNFIKCDQMDTIDSNCTTETRYRLDLQASLSAGTNCFTRHDDDCLCLTMIRFDLPSDCTLSYVERADDEGSYFPVTAENISEIQVSVRGKTALKSLIEILSQCVEILENESNYQDFPKWAKTGQRLLTEHEF